MRKRVVVRVPASSGNLGPGFDVLGLALELWNELHLSVISTAPGTPSIFIEGEGADALPRDRSNVILRTLAGVFRKAKVRLPQLELTCVNRIPLARGLGSSSAAVLAGLLAADALLGRPFSVDQILTWASAIEGHPDNVAPALLGGARASGVFDGKIVSVALPLPRVRLVVAIPTFQLSTRTARGVLPKRIPLEDAVSNLSAVALMPWAFAHAPVLLGSLLNDRLHEPYRAKLIPGFYAVKKAARTAGAYGVTLSGAGPTMLSFVPALACTRVAAAMKKAFARAGVSCVVRELAINAKGAVVS